MSQTNKTNFHKGSLIRCMETGKIYPSIRAASVDTGIGETAICNCCAGRTKTAGRLHWEYAESRCLSCRNAVGGCTWSALHPHKDEVWFRPVDGWDAFAELREYAGLLGKTYRVVSCPQYIPDPERDLSRYEQFDREIEGENMRYD